MRPLQSRFWSRSRNGGGLAPAIVAQLIGPSVEMRVERAGAKEKGITGGDIIRHFIHHFSTSPPFLKLFDRKFSIAMASLKRGVSNIGKNAAFGTPEEEIARILKFKTNYYVCLKVNIQRDWGLASHSHRISSRHPMPSYHPLSPLPSLANRSSPTPMPPRSAPTTSNSPARFTPTRTLATPMPPPPLPCSTRPRTPWTTP
jgi:hypothetical protein